MCARFFNEFEWLYTRGVHGQAAGCTLYEPVRPDGAQNKTLISNTVCGGSLMSGQLFRTFSKVKLFTPLHLFKSPFEFYDQQRILGPSLSKTSFPVCRVPYQKASREVGIFFFYQDIRKKKSCFFKKHENISSSPPFLGQSAGRHEKTFYLRVAWGPSLPHGLWKSWTLNSIFDEKEECFFKIFHVTQRVYSP